MSLVHVLVADNAAHQPGAGTLAGTQLPFGVDVERMVQWNVVFTSPSGVIRLYVRSLLSRPVTVTSSVRVLDAMVDCIN